MPVARLVAVRGAGKLSYRLHPTAEDRMSRLIPQRGRQMPVETAADRTIHLLGVPLAALAVAWLVARTWHTENAQLIVTMLVYAVGLIGMLSASAAYHLTRPGHAKDVLCRADHSMIFVMIAGTYTPLAVNALDPPWSMALCALVWSLSAAGIVLLLVFPRCFARVSLALYLGISWIILGVIRTLIDRLPIEAVALLVGGGVVYSVGALIHTRERWRFHTPVWHALVLLAARLHLTALYAAFLPAT
jgi:hemolysin III